MLDYTLFILGNGRKPYLERTIRSWETNLVGQPKHKIIFDDSGDHDYVAYLNEKFGNRFLIVPVGDKPMGHAYAMQFIFNYLKTLDTEYFFELEEDWVLFRSLDMSNLIKISEKNKNIIQVRVPRTITNKDDLRYGSTLSSFIYSQASEAKMVCAEGLTWYEWRGRHYFWSHNPSLFRKSIIHTHYPQDAGFDHESRFSENLFETNKDHKVAFYSSNIYDAYIEHIGFHEEGKMNYASEFDIFSIDI